MTNNFQILARNNLGIPIRLTVCAHGNTITIAVSEERHTKEKYPSVHTSKNLKENMDSWEEIGTLTVESKSYLKVTGGSE